MSRVTKVAKIIVLQMIIRHQGEFKSARKALADKMLPPELGHLHGLRSFNQSNLSVKLRRLKHSQGLVLPHKQKTSFVWSILYVRMLASPARKLASKIPTVA